ncbi:isochorismatase family protein [Streptomyces seoulensis]|uniref:isochorismatase family protein n=1 Tax=Streptomyces seoulensis TaxID=73044 RepID=UPI001FCAF305|nr:isochorismatase family protein [Streptomyces seoulensis]BDH06505.1 hypothetical protein HEK131_37320 [Streptomyces seoulensis]
MPGPALLVMDVQRAVTERVPDPGHTPRLARAVAAARAAGVPVVYVVVGFRPGRPEARSSAMFGALPEGAFTGSDLELVLRGGGIDHLVLTGLATSGVVLSTLRQAADLDHRLTVLADGCGDTDPEVHRVLTERVFPRQAEVTTVDAWISGLRR